MKGALQKYLHNILPYVQWWHLVVLGILALALIIWWRKRLSTYGAVTLGLAVFTGLALLDTAVVIRFLDTTPPNGTGMVLSVSKLIPADMQSRVELLANIAVFIPFGFFLAEFLTTRKRIGGWRRIGLSALVGFGLSLCVECLQLVFKVGWFELTDLVMNTVGAAVGAGLSVGWRRMTGRGRND
jgi:Glycopeptide antibiotics resistance protein